ncbi:MAG: aromatic ring-hydroxylating dioxygenase subunit alpha [Sulfolobus sp.]
MVNFVHDDLRKKLENAKEKIKNRRVPLWLFADKELFQLEQEKIFGKAWLFLAHESEIPNRGDYIVRYMGANTSVIVIRDEDYKIRAFYNICPHRGAKLCREDRGNSLFFKCPYHGLTFRSSGELVGLPARHLIAPNLKNSDIKLFEVKIQNYNGLIFGTMNPNPVSLDDFLGDMKFYLNILLRRNKEGLQFSVPQRWIIKANWKTIVDNFIGDAWHFLTAHGFAYEVGGIVPPHSKLFSAYAAVISLKGGHGVMFAGPDKNDSPDYPRPSYYPVWWPELLKEAKSTLSEKEYKIWINSNRMIGNVFPNLAFHNTAYGAATAEIPVPYQSFRLWRPLDVDKTEIWTWWAIEKDAPEKLKDLSFKTYIRLFGASGIVEPDDVTIWEGMTENSLSPISNNIDLFYFAGMHEKPDLSFEGPGEYYYGGNNEINQLNFFETYIDYLLSD